MYRVSLRTPRPLSERGLSIRSVPSGRHDPFSIGTSINTATCGQIQDFMVTNYFNRSNLFAAHVFQSSDPNDFDMMFGLKVLAAVQQAFPDPPVALAIRRATRDRVLLEWTAEVPATLESASELNTPADIGWAPVSGDTSPYLVPADGRRRFYRLRR